MILLDRDRRGALRLVLVLDDALAERFDVIAVDLPGFGHSPPLPERHGAQARRRSPARSRG